MKSIILYVVLSGMIAMNVNAQNQLPIIIAEKGRTLSTYQQNGKYLTPRELAEVLKSNSESVKEYNKSAALDNTGAIFWLTAFISSSAGGVCSGLSLIAYIKGHDDDAIKYRNYAGITLLSGLGFFIISQAIFVKKEAHLTKSINNYNNTLKTGRTENVIIYFGFTGEGVGVRLRF